MPKRRPAPPLIPELLPVPDPSFVNRRAKTPPTLKAQWIAAMADVTSAKTRLVDALLVLQGVQLDYMGWWDAQPAMFKKSARGKKLEKILALSLVLDVRHLTAAASVVLP